MVYNGQESLNFNLFTFPRFQTSQTHDKVIISIFLIFTSILSGLLVLRVELYCRLDLQSHFSLHKLLVYPNPEIIFEKFVLIYNDRIILFCARLLL